MIKNLLLRTVGNYAEKNLCMLEKLHKKFKVSEVEYIGLYRVIYT